MVQQLSLATSINNENKMKWKGNKIGNKNMIKGNQLLSV